MRVIALENLEKYIRKHRDAKSPLSAWYKEADKANWQAPVDIKRRYASASFLEDRMVIFNIKGNRYRLAVKVNYDHKIVRIKWFGTHARYDEEMKKKRNSGFRIIEVMLWTV